MPASNGYSRSYGAIFVCLYKFLPVGLSLALLFAIPFFIDIETVKSKLFALSQPRGLFFATLASGLVALQLFICGFRWRLLVLHFGGTVSNNWAFKRYYSAYFINQLLPSALAGDLFRAFSYNSPTIGKKEAIRIILYEKLSGQSITLLLATPALLTLNWLSSTAIILLIIGVAAVNLWFIPAKQLMIQWVVSAIFMTTLLLQFWLCTLALNIPLQFIDLMYTAPLSFLGMSLPISFGGWGVREAITATQYATLGYSAEDGTVVSILYGLTGFLGSIPGALYLQGSFSSYSKPSQQDMPTLDVYGRRTRSHDDCP